MLIDTYTAWAIRKVGEPFGFVRNSLNEIHLTDKEKAEGYNHMGYEAVEVVVDIKIKES
ncbi:hypothetical protein D3C87_324840 [compost metagenome]